MSGNTVERYGGIWIDKVNKLNPVEFSDDLVTEKRARDIGLDIVDKLKTASIQIISAEVTGVIYNEKDVEKTEGVDERHIGCIQVQCYPGFSLPTDWVYPLEANIKKYPVYGEMVAIICLGDQAYYFNPVNLRRSANHNSVVGATDVGGKRRKHDRDDYKEKLKGFKPEPARPTRQIAGDIVIDGRERQSIKLGKNDNIQSKSGPVIKLRIANTEEDAQKISTPKPENIVNDAASIYITEKEEISLTPARNVNSNITPATHTGKQILIDADKLIFNTKEGNNNNLGIYSGYNLNLISKNDSYIIGKRVYVGAEPEAVGVQPVVLGDALVELLYSMARVLEGAGVDLQSGTGISPLAGAPSIDPLKQKAGATMKALFGSGGEFSKANLKEALLSKHVYVSKQGK